MPNYIMNLMSFGDQPELADAFHQMRRDRRQEGGT